METLRNLLSMLLIVCCTTATASTYYASPNGSGNGNSYSSPCDLADGISKLQNPGDTLYLLGGQYDLGNTKVNGKNGSATAYIVIAGYPGEQAILDFRTTSYGTRGLQIASNCTYVHVKDMTLRYSGKNNLYNEGSYCLFENLDIYGSADTGCQMKNGGNNTIKNVDSHDNFDYKLDKSGNLTRCDFGGNADGFADKQHSGAANHYIGCRAWNNSDDGWDFFQRVTTTETIIENCICYKNGPDYYDMRNHPRYQTDKAWFDQFKTAVTVTDDDGNSVVVTLAQYPNMGNGNGFKVGGGYTDHKVLVHHSLAVANTVKGFDQNNNGGTMRFYNNTGYLNGYDFGFTTLYGTLSIQNNISYQSINPNATAALTTLVDSHNSWNMNSVGTAADFVSIDTTEILQARSANGDLVIENLFHLSANSKYIDQGTNVGLAYTGAAPDLGWKETDGVLHPTVTCTSNNAEQWGIANEAISPIVFEWGGAATRLKCSTLPQGLSYKISNNNHTLTISGSVAQAGEYTITVSTISDQTEVNTATATLHIKSDQGKRIAFITIPNSAEDNLILDKLRQSDSLLVTELDATLSTNDYSSYDVLILGGKPNSGAAAFAGLEGYDKPMLVLKPFLYKSSVWNWGTPVNTQDLSITVADTTHALFQQINFAGSNELTLFTRCNTNAVTAVSAWTNASTDFSVLASPVSQATYSTIADMPAGTIISGTTLTKRVITIGISEYSTAYLTAEALQVIENAVYTLMNMETPVPTPTPQGFINQAQGMRTIRKVVTKEGVRIIVDEKVYDLFGNCIE